MTPPPAPRCLSAGRPPRPRRRGRRRTSAGRRAPRASRRRPRRTPRASPRAGSRPCPSGARRRARRRHGRRAPARARTRRRSCAPPGGASSIFFMGACDAGSLFSACSRVRGQVRASCPALVAESRDALSASGTPRLRLGGRSGLLRIVGGLRVAQARPARLLMHVRVAGHLRQARRPLLRAQAARPARSSGQTR